MNQKLIVIRLTAFILYFVLYKTIGFAQSSGPFTPGTVVNTVRAGSTSSTTGLGNLTTDNNVYLSNAVNLASNGDYSDYFYATNFGFAINTSYTITGITVEIERSDANGKCKDNVVSLLKAGALTGSNKAVNAAWPTSDAVASYGGGSDLWGATWTPAEINDSNFGVAMSWERTGGGGSTGFAKIDRLSVTVSYSASSLLPVELTRIWTNCTADNVELTWETASEYRNDFFTVERSENAIHFNPVGTVKGAGTKSGLTSYYFADNSADKNLPAIYYRLKQTDTDGNFKLSGIVETVCDSKTQDLVFYPNPGDGLFHILKQPQGLYALEIYNTFGEQVGQVGTGTTYIDLSAQPAGLYSVKAYFGHGVTVHKIVLR